MRYEVRIFTIGYVNRLVSGTNSSPVLREVLIILLRDIIKISSGLWTDKGDQILPPEASEWKVI
jgi:hypothetical protein